eukprot:gnl/MRDRNA2_/MRDRNA2_127404_c0_seq1.p1 gnl/MRDRNA2_/MRDRNA2_127404_c0~~gnl/MRDRNA2_/MRDRNA2_127404_c0_seq1.p1  ORF type:complete len:356 (-),score=52.03 gnl/MRDRNA2_/MRDRNA2_127404_c0_seq1:118-1185(-)
MMEPLTEAPLLDTESSVPHQEGGERQSLQAGHAIEIQGDSQRCMRCHAPIPRSVVFVSSSIVGMLVVAAVGAALLRTVMPPGLGKTPAAEAMFLRHVVESPVALTTFFFFIMLTCALAMFCIWRLAHWQEARDVVAEQRAEEEQRKRNLLKHLRGTEAFEMPPPDKPVPRKAGTTTTLAQDEERRSTCAICLEPLNTGDPCRLLPCNHIFHTTCTDCWLQDRHSCPTCRQDIRAPEDIPAEPQPQQRQLPMRTVVLLLICITLMTGVQDRIVDAIFGVQNKAPQNHDVWAHPAGSDQNVTTVHRYHIRSVYYDHGGKFVGSNTEIGGNLASPADMKSAQDDNSAMGLFNGGFLRR